MIEDPELRDTIRRLAAMLRPQQTLQRRQGVVDTVNADGTVDVTLGGSDVVIPDVVILGGAVVAADEPVWLLQDGPDLLALGAPAASGWQDYTPSLTAATTNPTLGSGSTVEGRWCRIGSTVHVVVNIVFGTSGTSAGSGKYRVSLPAPMSADLPAFASVGAGRLFDGAQHHLIEVSRDDTSTTLVSFPVNGAGRTGATVPFAWGASDSIAFHCTYEAA